MKKRSAYIAFILALTGFIYLPGLLSYGQDDEDDVKRSGQTKYVPLQTTYGDKMDERTTGGDDEDAAAKERAAKKKAEEERAAGLKRATGVPNTDAGGIVPDDFYMNLPAPTPKEEQANLAAFLGGLPLAEAQNKVIGLRLLNSAYTFLGIPYQHDGRGDCVRGIDCSKLTRCAAIKAKLEPTSFVAMAGIQYGYALKKQYNMQMISAGSPASLARVQPGDFLFFNWRNQFCAVRPYNVGHVALYIGPTKGSAMYLIEAGDPVQKRWGNQKYLVGVGRIVREPAAKK